MRVEARAVHTVQVPNLHMQNLSGRNLETEVSKRPMLLGLTWGRAPPVSYAAICRPTERLLVAAGQSFPAAGGLLGASRRLMHATHVACSRTSAWRICRRPDCAFNIRFRRSSLNDRSLDGHMGSLAHAAIATQAILQVSRLLVQAGQWHALERWSLLSHLATDYGKYVVNARPNARDKQGRLVVVRRMGAEGLQWRC